MLIAAILIPMLAALVLAMLPKWTAPSARGFAAFAAAMPLGLLVYAWLRFDLSQGGFQHLIDLPWIPAVGAGLRFGVDGISLTVATLSALLFAAATVFPVDTRGRARQYYAWMLFLEAVSLGLFLTLDLLLFYVFFDLSLVGMYFLVAVWGHEDRERAALKFILFTLAGSLVMLLGILSLVLALDPLTFDMRRLIAEQPLAGNAVRGGWTLLALMFGLAVKTPLVPVHTWLPAAHVEAPAPASAILAGVLLKMGTYGIIRIAWQMMDEPFRQHSFAIGVFAVVSIVYGALVALGQRHIKRRIAYTSITHMGYTVLGIAMAASLVEAGIEAKRMALTGATLEMIAHGLITGSLFFIAGSLHQRTHSFEMDEHSGVAARAPLLTVAAVIAAFASLGLPGLAGFIAEFQIFAGSLAVHPWLVGIALAGVLVTAALFLQLLQVVFFGKPSKLVGEIGDLNGVEIGVYAVLLGLTIVIGVAPGWLVATIDSASRAVIG